ncbi:PIN domain protein [Chitinophaga oryziterrae]|uniref:PIN domain protein n=1 Tax=Chitinophaga oryziterrae TaxID=1031224 RepID=A0A6N8JH64_9BACT|nr:PIN domain protein [Chitinophaga oryziterrae]MVT44593.1 PIN domain protein [Chitinophaga oryziterrae]
MKKIYADTSVIGGCFDNEFKGHSLPLFDAFKAGALKLILSDMALQELEPAREEIRNKIFEIPYANIIEAVTTDEGNELASEYIYSGALRRKSYDDAVHIALATLNKADALASWNFKLIVNFNRIKMCNHVNVLYGYKQVEIMTPSLILKTIQYERFKTV